MEHGSILIKLNAPLPQSLHGVKSMHVVFFKQLQNGMGKQYKMTMGFFENVKACIGRQLHFRKARWLFTSSNALSGYNKSVSLSSNLTFGQVNMPL